MSAKQARRCSTRGVAFAILGLFAAAASADDAIYSVEWMTTNPPQVLVKIDTRPWNSDVMARTANVSVTFTTSDGGSVAGQYDFLGGATQPSYLAQGHIYARTFVVGIAGATGIQDSGVMFPSDEGKADAPTSTTTARRGAIAAPTDQVAAASGVPADSQGTSDAASEPAGSPHMQWYGRTNYQGSDFAHMSMSSVQDCSERCLNKAQCRVFTWVQGQGGGMCWLKGSVPSRSSCGNCISGIKSP